MYGSTQQSLLQLDATKPPKVHLSRSLMGHTVVHIGDQCGWVWCAFPLPFALPFYGWRLERVVAKLIERHWIDVFTKLAYEEPCQGTT